MCVAAGHTGPVLPVRYNFSLRWRFTNAVFRSLIVGPAVIVAFIHLFFRLGRVDHLCPFTYVH